MSNLQWKVPCTIKGGCGSSDAMVEYPNKFHCFACGNSRRKSYAEAHGTIVSKKETTKLEIPNDLKNIILTDTGKCTFRTDKIIKYYHWLNKYFELNRLPYCIKYSEELDKLVIETNELHWNETHGAPMGYLVETGFFMRGIEPKYTRQTEGVQVDVRFPSIWSLHKVVIVEDIFSAIKVSQLCPSICIFGSSVSKKKLERLLYNLDYFYKNGYEIVIWLDSDKAGVEGSNKLRKTLENHYYPERLSQRLTEKDPKEVLFDEMVRLL